MVKNLLFSTWSRPALGPIQPPIQWVPRALSPGVKRQGCEADHSHPTSAEVKKTWVYIQPLPIRLHAHTIRCNLLLNCYSLKFYKILFYASTAGVVHLSKRYSSISFSFDFYTVAVWVFACCFPYVIPLLWLRLQYVRILTNVN
jgi:hypothetical protein